MSPASRRHAAAVTFAARRARRGPRRAGGRGSASARPRSRPARARLCLDGAADRSDGGPQLPRERAADRAPVRLRKLERRARPAPRARDAHRQRRAALAASAATRAAERHLCLDPCGEHRPSTYDVADRDLDRAAHRLRLPGREPSSHLPRSRRAPRRPRPRTGASPSTSTCRSPTRTGFSAPGRFT